MRKVILFICAVFFCTLVSAQNFSLENNEYLVTDSLSQSRHWDNLNRWVSLAFKKAKYVVDYRDKETGKMIIKCTCTETLNYLYDLTYKYTLQIDCRDKKYRAVFSSIGICLTDTGELLNDGRDHDIRGIKEQLLTFDKMGVPISPYEISLNTLLSNEKIISSKIIRIDKQVDSLKLKELPLKANIDSLQKVRASLKGLDKLKLSRQIEKNEDAIDDIENDIDDINDPNSDILEENKFYSTIKDCVLTHKALIISGLKEQMKYIDNF